MSNVKIAVLVGSLRKKSFTKTVVETVIKNSPKEMEYTLIDIGVLPIYNQDLESENREPKEWLAFRDKIRGFDAVLFATPEHNRSVPAALKNALDVGSRPYGQNVFNAKPAAVISVSPGAIGGFGANHHLRQVLAFLNMPVMAQPEAYIGNVMNVINPDGAITNENTVGFLKVFTESFLNHIKNNLK
ncbi:MAG: NAD(P)H-dependent oxidoreductase [Bacilli bacterium]|jgi:chromate reductase